MKQKNPKRKKPDIPAEIIVFEGKKYKFEPYAEIRNGKRVPAIHCKTCAGLLDVDLCLAAPCACKEIGGYWTLVE